MVTTASSTAGKRSQRRRVGGAIATALKSTLAEKNIHGAVPDGEAVRKHVEVLAKRHKSQLSKEQKLSGVEPKETEIEKRLSGLVAEFIGRLQDEKSAKEKQKAAKTSSTEAGLAIRQQSLEGEPKKSKGKQNAAQVTQDEGDKPVHAKPAAIAKSPAIAFLELTNSRQDEKDEIKWNLLQREIEQENLRRAAARRAHEERLAVEQNERRFQREFQTQQLQIQRDMQAEMIQLQRESLRATQESFVLIAQALAAVNEALLRSKSQEDK